MNKRISILFIFLILFSIAPAINFAKNFDSQDKIDVTEYGADKIEAEGNKLGYFLFAYIMPFVAIISGAYGVINAFLASSIGPLVKYGGISIACIIMPFIIKGISTASSILLSC